MPVDYRVTIFAHAILRGHLVIGHAGFGQHGANPDISRVSIRRVMPLHDVTVKPRPLIHAQNEMGERPVPPIAGYPGLNPGLWRRSALGACVRCVLIGLELMQIKFCQPTNAPLFIILARPDRVTTSRRHAVR